MSQSRPTLYARIGYDFGLEAAAFERLARLDAVGCRERMRRLVEGLTLGGGCGIEVVHLLADVLQRVNRQVHGATGAVCQTHRVFLIETFARCRSAEAARRCFLPALDRLLARLPRRRARSLAERARRFIDENYRRHLSLSAVAASLHVSSTHLSRVFRDATGRTLTEHIHRVRLEHALALLAEDQASLGEIAYRVGYRNYRDFYRNFVKYEAAAPREVRRRLIRTG